ncbi:predicted protein [Chaetomium globosum CBS 148.51]|uniref:BZIP domain-containing protein n=1 Tax=Chaetomium globosum (strain ATCC 6205 / CBS 148.51 / DSM 1962 / NBRC 6347 / NRRL 1970) TaxID=306901 RepID=Q2HEN9_CHAGB|nr:uncharacterized protein CHGG_01315 [Chaetomium globosum CBS 148.51]EAQ93080.1 predicted protein [Chaetomium globosum CBS 148.51]
MEQPQPRPADIRIETERFDALAYSYPSSQHAVQSLAGWGMESSHASEPINQFQELSTPIGWAQQMSTTAPSTLGLITAAEPQYVPQTTDWHQDSSFGYAGFVESGWSRSNSVFWDPDAFVTANNPQLAADVTTLPPSIAPAYSPPQPEIESPVSLLSTDWQNDGLDRHRPYQLPPTSGYNFGSEGRSGVDGTWDESKPRRPPIQTKDLYGADHSINRFATLPGRRDSASDISSHTASPAYSVVGPSFDDVDAADAAYLSDTTTVSFSKPTRPRRRATPPSPATAGDDHNDSHHNHDHGLLKEPPSQHQTETPTETQQPPTQPPTPTPSQARTQARNRNRAAASRYRAKTQAASARLEATARTAAARHRVLRARASRLRDEVVRLKHELLARHAGCDCAMIRGYLEGAVRGVLNC